MIWIPFFLAAMGQGASVAYFLCGRYSAWYLVGWTVFNTISSLVYHQLVFRRRFIRQPGGLWRAFTFSQSVTVRQLRSLVCAHEICATFVHVDHASNPPPYEDVYKGECCCQCGWIFSARQVY